VLVGRDRGLVGLRALSGFGADLLLLDDGFQHHRLARDVDLVCFDGAFGLGNGHLLPRGPLREPLSVLRRADAIVCLDPPLPASDEARIRAAAPQAQWFAVHRRAAALRPLAGGAADPPERLRGAGVGMLCGIARPERLRRSLEALGARVVAERSFPDHHAYVARDLAGLAAQAPLWITTEKDAVKLLPDWSGRAEVRVLVEDLDVESPDALLDWLEQTLRQRRQLRA
jgi:tetraacyldisaccharide 4'-kinase